VGRHAATQDPLHVLYVGSSADLGALRRLMEAHGAITRSRLTPEVTVVITDSSVPPGHPALRDAGMLGIPVMEPAEAIIRFADWRSCTDVGSPTEPAADRSPALVRSQAPPAEPTRPAAAARRSWLFRRSAS